MGKIIEYASYYLITDVYKVPYAITNDLSKWNPGYFRLDNIGFHYDENKKELRIPKGYKLENITYAFPYHEVIPYFNDNKYDKISIGLLAFPRDYIQEDTLAFMTGNEPYAFTKNENQIYIDLDTGTGKTYAMIATACYYQAKTAVFIPAISKVASQWIDTIDNFTTLNTNEYLYVSGSEMCKDIMRGKYKNVKIFIIPRSTVLAFVRKYDNNWNMLTELVKAMDVSIKGIDEAHMDFNTIVNIDCFTEVDKTYYMSSSPSRSDEIEKRIYKKVFQNVLRHGKKLKTKEQNHIIPLIINFKSTPTEKQLKQIKTRYGTSLAKYGEYLLDEEGARDEFIDAYSYALYCLLKYRRDGGKILVICITIDFAKELQKITKLLFPFLSSGLFVGSGKDKEKELNNDIIFSTTKSMGTGSEIKNHQLTINTITYSSEVMVDQISGRIRQQSGRKGIYCELVNVNHKIAKDHYNKREKYLKLKAKNGKILIHDINNNDLRELTEFFSKHQSYNSDGMILQDNKIVIHRK